MQRLMAAFFLFTAVAPLHAQQVVDDFESGTNPNGWSWLSGSPGNIIYNGVIQPAGGNPGAWFDSTTPYFSDHPNQTAVPDTGTPLRDALDSAALTTISLDLQRLDTSSVQNCHPIYDLPSNFTLELIDLHTESGTLIEAHTTDGPPSPGGTSFAWMPVAFTIPSDATDTPPGWVLNAPPELNYTWSELMHNLDGISVFVINPEEITYDSCWELGADNIVVSYAAATTDKIFVDGFDGGGRGL